MSTTPSRRLKRVLAAVAVLVAVVVAGPPLAVEVLYRYTLRELGPPPAPPSPETSSPFALTAFWVHVEGTLPPSVEPISAWGWVWRFAFSPQSWRTPRQGERMATQAARVWITPLQSPPGMGNWHRRFWASTLWMIQHRTAAQLTQTVMDGSYYGRGATGFDAASLAYFGRPSGDLAPHEVAQLLALRVSPSRHDVDCHPDEFIAARNHLLDRLLSAGAISRPDHDLAAGERLGVIPRECRLRQTVQPTPEDGL